MFIFSKKSFLFVVSFLLLFSFSLQASKVGEDLPKLKIKFVTKKIKFSGKPLLIEFWATWCPPCKKSIPHLNKLYDKYKDKGLIIIGITGDSRSMVKKFMKTTPISYSVATDSRNKMSKLLGIKGIPHAFLIDKDGKIIWEGHPASLKESDIEKILK